MHVRAVVGEVIQRSGRVDVLVNNAGITLEGLVEDLSDEDWDRCFDVTMLGARSRRALWWCRR